MSCTLGATRPPLSQATRSEVVRACGEARGGEHFTIHPGDILLAEDNTGTGHRWKLIGDEPWRRAYLTFPSGATLPFKAKSAQADAV